MRQLGVPFHWRRLLLEMIVDTVEEVLILGLRVTERPSLGRMDCRANFMITGVTEDRRCYSRTSIYKSGMPCHTNRTHPPLNGTMVDAPRQSCPDLRVPARLSCPTGERTRVVDILFCHSHCHVRPIDI
ncbi:hypothetical protein CONLIGDRAFT_41945 [Coniochaeta ligniaria NRRL 30616]|uniref:Uncharacterized protein n=1 Tax=Coniochaeta ligniaria NRRL 30616 TaxID=1408157 RepID=A0A1J7J5Q9_9PEZI|nr:hypothetical protein CONLIGDRAFT_41945 [Coniochaeta ligniaria NRRL 30616]